MRVIAVTSGKGGVGKTNIVANVAVAMANRGKRVLVLDADLGLGNIDVLLGLAPSHTMLHVLRGERSIGEVLLEGPAGIHIIPAASGIEELTALGAEGRLVLLQQLETLEGDFDVLLLDTAAGISSNVLYFDAAAHQVVVVIAPEPTALTDAYALMKVLCGRGGLRRFAVVVNLASGEGEARRTFAQLARVAERFLGVGLEYLGYVPVDSALPRAVCEQTPLVLAAPASPASRALVDLAARLAAREPEPASGGVQFFFRHLVEQGRAVRR